VENKTVVKMVFGSHLYGLNNADSDTDFKSIILPTKRDILLGRTKFSISESTGDDDSKNDKDDVDMESYSFHKFIEMACKGDTSSIDMLHAPKSAILETSDTWEWLVKNRSMFYTKNMKSYIGYVKKQAAKYGIKGSKIEILEGILVHAGLGNFSSGTRLGDILDRLPINDHAKIEVDDTNSSGSQRFYVICGRKFQDTIRVEQFLTNLRKIYDSYGARAKAAKENKGIDWKAVSHALRAGYQARHIYTNGGFSYPLPETGFLLDVKEGRLDYINDVQPALDSLVDEVFELSNKSNYPDNITIGTFENHLARVHENIVLNIS